MNNMSGGTKQQMHGIVAPHEHDVLSGRGNFVNYHAGNEHFRALVRKHKLEYVRCPKPQKGKFSRMIVDEIKGRIPPGRFLKQDASTKLWYDIGDKKALDKTRQALREGAPEIMKDMVGDEVNDGGGNGLPPNSAHSHGALNAGGGNDAFHGGGPGGGVPQDAFLRAGQQHQQHGGGGGNNNPNFGRNSAGVADLSQAYMAAGMAGLQSPGVGQQRHQLHASPQIGGGRMASGGMMGMPNTPLSPDLPGSMQMNMQSRMQQMASGQLQMQQQQQQQQQHLGQQSAVQQQITSSNQLAQMALQNQMMAHAGAHGMQHLQNDLEALRVKQRQIEMLQAKQREMEALQAQLNSVYQQSEQLEPRPIELHGQSNTQNVGRMRKPKTVPTSGGSGSGGDLQLSQQQQQQALLQLQQQVQQQQQQARKQQQREREQGRTGADAGATGNEADRQTSSTAEDGARRKPPPTLKRENSLKIEKVFVGDGSTPTNSSNNNNNTNNAKKKYDGNGSSAHLSAMSLSIGDMADETNLSSVFDSSLQISSEEAEFRDTLSPLVRKKQAIPVLTNAWDAKNPFDMSVNTINDKISEVGNMSVNTFGDKMGESESNMSFSKVFEDSSQA